MTLSRLNILYSHLNRTSYYYDPASSTHHGNYEGGLYEHSRNVARNLQLLTDKLELEWEHPDSPEIIGIAHDVCKIGQFIHADDLGYVKNPYHPSGHGDLSVDRVSQWIRLSKEEIACIRWHMGAYTPELKESPTLKKDIQKSWSDFQKAIQEKKYGRQIYFTHVADMMATNFDEVPEEASS